MEKQVQERLTNEVIEELKTEGFFSEEKLTIPIAYRTVKRIIEKVIEKVKIYHKYENTEEVEKINGYDMYVVGILEKTIGKDKIKEMYIDSNLFGLIGELKKYALETEINDFIQRVNFLKNNLTPYTDDENLKNSLLENLKKVNEFLAKVHVKKLRGDLDNSLLSEQEFYTNIQNYCTSIPQSITINNMNYQILSIVELSQIINPIINSSYNDNEVQNSVKK